MENVTDESTSNGQPVDELRFPVGRFEHIDRLAPEQRMRRIAELEAAPLRLEQTIRGLNDFQLDTPYRPGGWTAKQVVHHLADSHLNGYLRLKWTLTEDEPTIKPYDQDAWSALPDAADDVKMSLALLDALHARWARLLMSMTPEQFSLKLYHPESGTMTLDCLLAEYAWHGRHHIAHIRGLRERRNW